MHTIRLREFPKKNWDRAFKNFVIFFQGLKRNFFFKPDFDLGLKSENIKYDNYKSTFLTIFGGWILSKFDIFTWDDV